MDSTLKRTWASIDLDALAYNCRHLQERMGPGARMLGVVKADAYGHGAVQVAACLERLGAEYLAVASLDEARELRRGGVGLPVLQLGATPADQSAAILANGVTQAVYSERSAQGFSREALKAGGTMRVHIKLDTGMSRLGFQCDEAHFEDSLEAIDQPGVYPPPVRAVPEDAPPSGGAGPYFRHPPLRQQRGHGQLSPVRLRHVPAGSAHLRRGGGGGAAGPQACDDA